MALARLIKAAKGIGKLRVVACSAAVGDSSGVACGAAVAEGSLEVNNITCNAATRACGTEVEADLGTLGQDCQGEHRVKTQSLAMPRSEHVMRDGNAPIGEVSSCRSTRQ